MAAAFGNSSALITFQIGDLLEPVVSLGRHLVEQLVLPFRELHILQSLIRGQRVLACERSISAAKILEQNLQAGHVAAQRREAEQQTMAGWR